MPKVSILEQPLHNKDKTRDLVFKAVELLKETTFSRWQNEAAVRTGFRVGLILNGHGWQVADDEAARIVRFAFNKIGRGKHTRPTADEARDEYYVPIENCIVCYGPLDEDQIGKTRFCCMEHAKFQYLKREYAEHRHNSEFALAARKIVYREKFGQRKCAHEPCGRTFWPASDGQKYCKPACLYESQRITYQPRECALDGCPEVFTPRYAEQRFCCQAHATASFATAEVRRCARDGCDYWFKPKHNNEKEGGRRGLYCSRECSDADRGNRVYELRCECCGDPFTASMPNAKYCCEGHRQIVRKFERGQSQRLSPGVFDYLFIMNGSEPHPIHDLFDNAA